MKSIFKGVKFGDVFYTAGYKPLFKGDDKVKPQKGIFLYKEKIFRGDTYYVVCLEKDGICHYNKSGMYAYLDNEGYGNYYSDKPGDYILDIIKKEE